MSKLVTLQYNEIPVIFQSDDAYINATQIAKAFGKKPETYLKTEVTKEYISSLESHLGSTKGSLVRTHKGGTGNGGTWIHPSLAQSFARWLNKDFGFWLDLKLCEIMKSSDVMNTLNELISNLDVDDVEPDRYVYVAKESISGRFKIGISKNPEQRIKNLNTGNPEKLILIHSYLATEQKNQSEAIAHALYSSNRLYGEWFDKDIDLSLLPN